MGQKTSTILEKGGMNLKFLVETYDPQEVLEAISHKADGIIVSIEFFSARCLHATDFEGLVQMYNVAKEAGLEVYIDVTRMFTDEELPRLEGFLKQCQELQLDGIYFSDMSVFEVCNELGMGKSTIYQPDTMIVNTWDAKVFLEDMKRVVLAKELTLEECCQISSDIPGCVEMFLHGRELMSISKRALVTNYFEEIAHSGKMEPYYYLVEEKRDEKMIVMENEQGTHFFSGFTLCSFKELSSLISSHISHGRISHMFLEFDEMMDALDGYVAIREGADACAIHDNFVEKYSGNNYQSGFYYQKTSVRKEY